MIFDGFKRIVCTSVNFFSRSPASPEIVLWEPVTSSRLTYLLLSGGEVSTNVTITNEHQGFDPHQQRMTFWNDNYARLYKAPSQVSSATKLMSLVFTVGLLQWLLTVF